MDNRLEIGIGIGLQRLSDTTEPTETARNEAQNKLLFRTALQALSKRRNAELAYWGGSLRASQEGAIRHLMPLGKDRAIPCEACLAASPFLTR